MQKTRERNGVLIFVVPRAHKFAVIGDEGVHEKCGEEFWQQLVNECEPTFKMRISTELCRSHQETGKFLAAHFPSTGDTINELPDEIVEG